MRIMKMVFYVLGVIGVILLFIPSGYFTLLSWNSLGETGTVYHKLFWSIVFLDSLFAASALVLLKKNPRLAGTILLFAGTVVFLLFGILFTTLRENLLEFTFSILGGIFFIPALIYIFIGTFILRRL